MKDYDYLRGTGRTTRMLERAIMDLFNGFDVIVTAFTFQYSLDLMHIVYSLIRKDRYVTAISDGVIYRGDNMIIFTKHFDNEHTPLRCKYVNPSKTYRLHEDHFKHFS